MLLALGGGVLSGQHFCHPPSTWRWSLSFPLHSGPSGDCWDISHSRFGSSWWVWTFNDGKNSRSSYAWISLK